jgi:hypothetical protein
MGASIDDIGAAAGDPSHHANGESVLVTEIYAQWLLSIWARHVGRDAGDKFSIPGTGAS